MQKPDNYSVYIKKIIENFDENELIYNNEISQKLSLNYNLEINKAKIIVNQILKRLADKEEIISIKKGIYVKNNVDKCIEKLYQQYINAFIKENDQFIGFEGYKSLVKKYMGEPLEKCYLDIVSNKYRYKIPENMNIKLRKPVERIDNKNCVYLQFLDLFTNCELTEKVEEMLLEMVKKEKLSSMYILNYAKKYYKDIYLHKLIDFIFLNKNSFEKNMLCEEMIETNFSNINYELMKDDFIKREYEKFHASYEKESEFYESITSGDIDKVLQLTTQLATEGYGKLSEDNLRNLKYHLIISVAMITRFCIEKGMNMEQAYSMSDVYINKADMCCIEEDIHILHREMILEFTKRMKNINNKTATSKQIVLCIDYINNNLHLKISLEDLAKHLSLTPTYISQLFHSETGTKLNEYIKIKKIEAASNMIKFSNFNSIDISNYFNFSSHSYFIKVFKQYTGLTPKEYKEKYFRIYLTK